MCQITSIYPQLFNLMPCSCRPTIFVHGHNDKSTIFFDASFSIFGPLRSPFIKIYSTFVITFMDEIDGRPEQALSNVKRLRIWFFFLHIFQETTKLSETKSPLWFWSKRTFPCPNIQEYRHWFLWLSSNFGHRLDPKYLHLNAEIVYTGSPFFKVKIWWFYKNPRICFGCVPLEFDFELISNAITRDI